MNSWRIPLLLLLAGSHVVISFWLDGPIVIPGRTVKDVVTPFAPLLFAFGMVACSRALVLFVPEVRHRRRAARRTRFLLVVWMIGGLSTVLAATIGSTVGVLALERNLALFLGFVTILGVSRSTQALFLASAYCCACWILGSMGTTLPPRAWALPLQPLSHLPTLGISVLAWITGAARFVFARPWETVR